MERSRPATAIAGKLEPSLDGSPARQSLLSRLRDRQTTRNSAPDEDEDQIPAFLARRAPLGEDRIEPRLNSEPSPFSGEPQLADPGLPADDEALAEETAIGWAATEPGTPEAPIASRVQTPAIRLTGRNSTATQSQAYMRAQTAWPNHLRSVALP